MENHLKTDSNYDSTQRFGTRVFQLTFLTCPALWVGCRTARMDNRYAEHFLRIKFTNSMSRSNLGLRMTYCNACSDPTVSQVAVMFAAAVSMYGYH